MLPRPMHGRLGGHMDMAEKRRRMSRFHYAEMETMEIIASWVETMRFIPMLAGMAMQIHDQARHVDALAWALRNLKRLGRVARAQALATARSRSQFDPALVDVICADGEKVFQGIGEVGSWDAVIDAEPALAAELSDEECDRALLAIARRVGERVEERLAGGLDELRTRAASTLGGLEQPLVALVGSDAPLDSCHGGGS